MPIALTLIVPAAINITIREAFKGPAYLAAFRDAYKPSI